MSPMLRHCDKEIKTEKRRGGSQTISGWINELTNRAAIEADTGQQSECNHREGGQRKAADRETDTKEDED